VGNPLDRAAEPRPLPFTAAAAGGLVSLLVQSVVLRESLFGSHLSELVSGIVLAGWLAASGTGAALAGRIVRRRAAWGLSMLALPPAGFLQVALSRTAGLHPALACIPAGLAAGAVFIVPFAGRPPGRVYAAETLGAVLGGALFVVLSPRILATGMFAAAAVLAAVGLLAAGFRRVGAAALLPIPLLFVTGLDRAAARWLCEARLGAMGAIELHASPYGETAVVTRSGQTSICRNGLLEASSPSIEDAESAVVVPLLAAAPETVLHVGASPDEAWLISGWPGVRRFAGVVPDPVLPRLVGYPPGTRGGDARRFLSREDDLCADLVIVSEGQPLSLLSNRYYTREFFSAAAARLRPGGVLSVRLPGGAARLHPLEARLASSVRSAALEVFDWVLLLPSGGLTLLAGMGEAPVVDGDILAARMDSIGASGVAVNPGTLPWDLSAARIDDVVRQVAAEGGPANSDLHPAAFEAAQELWRIRSGGPGSPIPVGAAVLLGLAAAAAASVAAGRPRAAAALSAAGASGLVVETLAVVMIQATTGLSWMLVGAVTGVYMAGAASGALLQSRGTRPFGSLTPVLLVSAAGAGGAGLSALVYDRGIIGGGALTLALLAGVLLSGLSGGAAFPAAASLLPSGGNRTSRLGMLDLAEHGAAAAAAVAAPLLLFPSLGAPLSLFCAASCPLLASLLLPRRA